MTRIPVVTYLGNRWADIRNPTGGREVPRVLRRTELGGLGMVLPCSLLPPGVERKPYRTEMRIDYKHELHVSSLDGRGWPAENMLR